MRDEWGFDGYVVSDGEAVEQLYNKHRTVADGVEAAAKCVNAGLNVRTNFTPPSDFIIPLRKAVERGLVSDSILDLRVAQVLDVKMLSGCLIILIPVWSKE